MVSPAASAADNRSQKALRNASAFPSKAAAVFAIQSSPLGSHKQRSIGGLEPESLLTADGSAKMCRTQLPQAPAIQTNMTCRWNLCLPTAPAAYY